MMRPSDAESRIRLASELSSYLSGKVAPAATPVSGSAEISEPGRGSGVSEDMLFVSANHIRTGFDPTPSVNRYEPVTDSKVEQYGQALTDGASLLQIPNTHLMAAMDFASNRFDKQVLVSEGDRLLTMRYTDNQDSGKVYFISHTPSEWGSHDEDYHALLSNEIAFLMGLPVGYMRPANAGTNTDTLFILSQSVQDAVVGEMSEIVDDPDTGGYDPLATFDRDEAYAKQVPAHVIENLAAMVVFDWVVGIDRLPFNMLVVVDRKGSAHIVPITSRLAMTEVSDIIEGFGGAFVDSFKSSPYMAALVHEVKMQRASVDGIVSSIMAFVDRAAGLDFDKLESRFDEEILKLYVPSVDSQAYKVYGGFLAGVQERSEGLRAYTPLRDSLVETIQEMVR
jgi:hypothetical protein